MATTLLPDDDALLIDSFIRRGDESADAIIDTNLTL
jgi:hypothetical protein